MEDDDSYPLYVGLTRPSMTLGVTTTGVGLNMMVCSCVFIGMNSLWALLPAVPIHGIMWLICKYEPRQFELLYSWAMTQGQARTRYFWGGGSTYAP